MTIKDIITYLRNKREINYHYGYACREGYCFDEDAGWQTRLAYWLRSDAYDPGDEQ